MGHWRVLADGVLAGIERVCAEPGRAAQGTRHHRGGQLPVRAGPRLRLLQGKDQPAESRGNRAYLSERCRVLLGMKLSLNSRHDSAHPLNQIIAVPHKVEICCFTNRNDSVNAT